MNQRTHLPTDRKKGVALVLVLGFIVLLTAMIVAFFSTTSGSLRDSSVYEAGVSVKQLADIATNLVIGQIADGTRSWEVPPADSTKKGGGVRLAYTTQPGLIRTYDDAGNPGRTFKLYSSDTMVASAGTEWNVTANLATEIAPDWPAQPAIYTDLNQPVLVEDTKGAIQPAGSGRKFSAAFPILDPLALKTATNPGGVDGFDLQGVPGYKTGGRPAVTDSDDPTAAAGPGKTSNPAAMPVKWIYILKDGSLTSPTGVTDGGLTAEWSGLPDTSPAKPTKANPIVGRLAFWTDDETCKLNVNTAGEPTAWDTPRAITKQDLNYGRFQPAYQEFQRFPGHPFTTALSPVLFPSVPLTKAQKEDIYKIIPRLGTGGTLAATMSVADTKFKPITLDEDRLYANMDEFLFAPPTTSGARPENPVDPASTLPNFRDQLKRSRFFLTANSRAPEITLFGTPRISLWPVPMTSALRTTFDSLTAFCSTVGPGSTALPFYFQRLDSTSPTADYDSISRNQTLYKYLQTLTGQPVPGYGSSFLKKWGDDRDQVLTEIFDYIRCVNLRDPQGKVRYADNGQVAPIQIGTTKGFGRFHTISQFGFHFICSQEGVKGIVNGETKIVTKGATDAKNPELSDGERAIEAAFIIEPFSPSLGWYKLSENLFFEVNFLNAVTINGQDLKFQSGGRRMSGSIGQGFHGREIGGAGGIRAPISSFMDENLDADKKKVYTYAFAGKAAPRVKIPTAGGTMSFSGGRVEVKVYAGNSADPKRLIQRFDLTFPSGQFPIPTLVQTGTSGYRGATVTTKEQWWTFDGYVPPGKEDKDRISGRYGGKRVAPRDCPHAPGPEYTDPIRRFGKSGGDPGFKSGGIFRAEDVVRSIVPEHGDIRLIAAQKEVGAGQFVKVRADKWEDDKSKFLHIFQAVSGTHHHFGFCNEPGPLPAPEIPAAADDDQLFGSAAVPMHYSRLPEIRPGAGKLYNRWGDFDNSIATWTDGAYINKPDEGNTSASQSVGGTSYPYFSWTFAAATETYFSPSRLVPSPGMFGSLPTGVKRHSKDTPHAWETLLFRPELRTATGGQPHPGTVSPKDHLIMDLFWMPVGEPYPISEPFSTAGKINLNYEIAPFSYIRRATALHGALKSEEPLVLINAASKIYKLWDHETNDHPFLPNHANNTDPQVRADWDKAARGQPPFDKMRRPIDATKTLAQADKRFAAGNAFRSASEICELHLVREGETLESYTSNTIWPGGLITGDNVRERPYTNLHAKLTTRSNTFTVHMRVQTLRKRPGTVADYAVWREGSDAVTAEHRGSTLIERYIDSADPNLPDFATNADATLDNFHKVRIVHTKKFNP